MKKILTLCLAFVIAFTTVFTGIKFASNNTNVKAAEMEPTMKMPITIYDHLDDHFFFQYDLGTLMGMSMYENYTEPGVPDDAGVGLVSDTLGENGTPVYKKEALEKAAEIMKDYIEQEYTVDNELHNNIKDWVSTPGSDTLISGNATHQQNLETLGWTVAQATDYNGSTYNQDKWYNGDDVIYYLTGDTLKTDVGGVDNTATFDFGELEAGTYSVFLYSSNNMTVEVQGPGVDQAINGGYTVITLDQPGHLFLKATPNGNGEASITHPSLYKGEGNDRETIIDNITIWHNQDITKEGWVLPAGSSWEQSVYGGITCDSDEAEPAYIDLDVEPGKSYVVYAQTNDSNLCVAEVTTLAGEKLANVGANTSKDNKFVVPDGVNKVRVKVLPTGEGYKDAQPVRRYDNLHLRKLAEVRLGDYEESKAAYTTNHTKNSLSDIETCMDYCYYVANNFWSNTNDDVTQKTNAYKTLTLNLNEGTNLYEFDSQYKKVYDTENKNIYNPSREVDDSDEQDFFPIDPDVLGAANDLTEPFGTTTNSAYVGDRNFHYAMKAHCEFYYDKASDLQFYFYGDDDVYLYINNKLVLDLGGAHPPKANTIKINDIADEIGLEDGGIYSFDFFYMERHTDMSKLRVMTNMVLLPADAKPSVVLKDKNGTELPDGTKVQAGEKVYPEYSVKAGVNGMKNVQFEDKELGFKIGKNAYGSNYMTLGECQVDENITVQVKDKNGNVKKTLTLSKEYVDDMQRVEAFVDSLMNTELDKDDTLTLSGIYKKMPIDEVLKTELHTDITAPNISYNDDGNVVITQEPVALSEVEAYVVPKNTPAAEIDVKIVDAQGNELTQNVTEGTEVGVDYTMTAQSDSMDDLGITDSGIGFSINKNGITIPDDFTIPDGLNVTVTKNGESETVTITQADIDNKTEAYNNLLNKLGNDWVLNKGDTISVTGLKTNMPGDGIEANATGSINGPEPSYNEQTGAVTVSPKTVNPTDTASLGAKDNVKVKFVVDPEKGTTGENDKMNYTVDVGETTGAQPTVTPKEGYTFTGWKKTTDSSDTPVDAADPKSDIITENTTYTAQFEPIKYPYTVIYVDENDEPVAEPKTGPATAFNETVTETAVKVQGMTVQGTKTQDLKITADPTKNVIKFVYELGGYDYTVRYVDEDGNPLSDPTEGSAKYDTDVETHAKTFQHYTLINENPDEILHMTDDPEKNVVTYVYYKNPTVQYKADKGGELTGNTDDREVQRGDKVEDIPNPEPKTGYEFAGWVKTTVSQKDPVKSENPADDPIYEDTVYTAKFNPLKYDYIVKYVDEDGNEVLPQKAVSGSEFDSKVTETAEKVAGYELKGDSTQSITIKEDGNVITFVYKKAKYNVTYDPVKNGKITSGDAKQTVDYGKTTKDPTVTPNKGYKFKGWVMVNEDGSETEILDPSKITITRDTVFKAKYTKVTTKKKVVKKKKTTTKKSKKKTSKKKTSSVDTDNTGDSGSVGGTYVDASTTSPQTSNTMLFVMIAAMLIALFGAVVSMVNVRRKK